MNATLPPSVHPSASLSGAEGPSGPPPSFGDRPAPEQAHTRRLSGNEFTATATVGALVIVLGLIGFVNSFAAIEEAARPSFGSLSWTVPVGIDLGIAIFAALDIVLARLNMRVRWLRLIVWALTGATVYLNVAHQTTIFAMVAHAILPGLWVAAVEVGGHVIRVRAGIEAGTRMDGIRASRWMLAPWPTLKLWRRMILWEERSYPAALDRERARVLALTDLKDAYGVLGWRWKAPRRVKALYRLGDLDTLTPVPVADSGPVTVTATPDTQTDTPADTVAGTVADRADRRALPAVGHPTATDPDTRPDTDAVTRPDSGADTGASRVAVTVADTRRPAVSAPVRSRTAPKKGAQGDRQDRRARALLANDPDMTGAELGRRLKVSERTGARLRNRITAQTTASASAQEGVER